MSEAIQALTNTLASMTDTSQTQPTQEGSDQVQVAPQAPQAPVAPAPNPETPMKRRPGRPKGSGKKQTDSSAEPKLKRPVGRPRKDGLPAGSVGPKRPPGRPRKRPPGTFAASSAGQSPAAFPTYPVVPYGEQWPASVSAPPMASLPGRPPAPPMAIDPSLDSNDWASLRHRPDIFLHNLVASLSAPNPIPSSGVPVEEAFKAHLFSLQSNGKNGSPSAIPQLYSTLRTFWMPSSPAYFSLTASATTTPSEYRFFYWDPHTLVFNGIACPVCGEAVSNKGRITSGPIKVYDLGKPFFIIGCEYACLSETCRPGSPRGEGRKYSSTDASILRSLPVKLRDEFPAKLIQGPPHAPDLGSSPEVWSWRGMGVSIALWNMVRACLNVGLRKDAILAVVKGVIDGVPEDPIPSWFPPPQQYAISVERKPDVETSGQPSGSNESREEGEEEEDEVEETVSEAARDKNPEQATYEGWNVSGAAGPSNAVAGPSEPNGHRNNDAVNPNQTVQQQIQQSQPPSQQLEYPPPPPPPQHFTTGQQAPYMSFTPYGAPPYAYAYPPAPPPTITNSLKRPYTMVDGSPQAEGSASVKRIRHCVKCGSHECKGKGGRAFCKNPCQDCGRLECNGRNSKRPDRSCKDAWEGEQAAVA